MTAAWPATLPAQSDDHSYQETPQPAAIRFEPEVGDPIGRRRSTVQLSTVTFAFVLTAAQVDDFEAFVNDTLASGVLPFTIAHPRKGIPVTAKLTGDPPYQIAGFSPDVFSVRFTALVRE